MWPKYVDMTDNECKLMLRKLELEAYSNIVSALRAQGPLTDEKQGLLIDIASELHIPRERYSAEIRRAVNDEKLSTIALQIYGPNTEIKWAIEGRREIPLIPRLHAQTAYSFLADKIANITATENAKLPFPTKANRKEVPVKTCKKTDVPENRSTKKSKKASKVLTDEKEEEKPEETPVKAAVDSNTSVDKTAAIVSVEPVIDINKSKISFLEEISQCERVVDSITTAKKDESSPVRKRKIVARTNLSKPVATVVSKNVKNGRTVVTAKTTPSTTRKATQIISAVKPTTPTIGAKMVAVSSNPSSTLKVVNKSIGSHLSSNSPMPLSTPNSVVTGIKVMTPRSSATAGMPRTPHGTEFPRFIRPNISAVRPNVTNSLPGVKHNVVVMQKNPQAKRGVTISSKDLADKMLKRKPSNNIPAYSGPTVSKVPKFSQEGSQGVSNPSQGNIIVIGSNQGNSSSHLPESSKLSCETASGTNSVNIGNNVKTITKSKIILPHDIPKPVMSSKVISPSASSEIKTLLPRMTPATTSFISESKPSTGSSSTKVAKAHQPISLVPDRGLNRILTSSSVSSFSDSVASSTKIIITDNEGKVLGTVPSASISGSHNQLNLLLSMTSASSATPASKSITVFSNSAVGNETTNKVKSVVVASSNKSNFNFMSVSNVSTSVPEKISSRSNVPIAREKLVLSSSLSDRPLASPKIQPTESEFIVEAEPIVVNVPSTSDIECSSSFISHCSTSALTDVNEVLVSINEAEMEDVGVLDPVTGIYSFPFDENESNQDSTVSVNSLPSSTDLADQLECNINSQVLSVSPVPDSAMDSSLSHIVVEPATPEVHTTELNETSTSSETTNECDISNISITEVTLEETLECLESATDEMYTEEVADKDPQNTNSVLDNL